MNETGAPAITVLQNGPYLVSGGVPLAVETIGANAEGGSWEWVPGRSIAAGERYALCRCGASGAKPFCDGTHAKNGFDGAETASRVPFAEAAKRIAGPELVLDDAEALCAFARFCDNGHTIWRDVGASDDPAVRSVVIHEGTHCPSGRLVLRETAGGNAVEPVLERTIGLVQDPAKACSGPLYVKGEILVRSHDGTAYEVRNRVTLCRCGASQNKPFCDGTHADIGFQDGLVSDAHGGAAGGS